VRSKNRQKTIEILFNLEHPEGPPVEATEIDDGDEFTANIEDVESEDIAERDIQEELRKRTFVVSGRVMQNDPLWVSVSDVFRKTDSQILKSIGITSEDKRWDKYSDRLQKLRKISDYQYVMQVLEKGMSYEEVTEIFVRVNSLGAKLRGSDLAMAQITSKWKGFLEITEKFASNFKDDENYILDTNLPVRMMVVLATKQSKFKTVGRIPLSKLKNSWELAKGGLEYAINFVRQNAGFDNLLYLSSPFLLVPIATYWVLKDGKEITSNEEKAILQWFYYAHMRGHYSMGSSEGILDQDLSALFKTKKLSELIKKLQSHVKKFELDTEDLAGKGIRSPFFSMLYIVLKEKGVKDWWSGLKLSEKHVGMSHNIEYHHIFPKSLLRDKYNRKDINEIANFAFISGKKNKSILNKEPKIYLKEIVKKQGKEALTEHLIPTEENLWQISNFQSFLDFRREAIVKEINNYMNKFRK